MIRLELDESRRLTGPNLLWDKPGAILDVWVEGIPQSQVVTSWRHHLERIQKTLDWQEPTTYRLFKNGISLALSAPMDALYSACEMAEFAWQLCVEEFTSEKAPAWQETIERIRRELQNERNPQLLSLMAEAEKQGVSCISDDDFCSLGMGSSVDVWAIDSLPPLQDIEWSCYSDIPLALITGTNGKSTSVRLASEIAKSANIKAGVTSTDFIKVGDEIIDTGDYSGPGGARMLIRDKRTEMAFLEVARGGILRRGLPVTRVNAGLITNIAEDHLGQYGIDTVEELAQAKFVIAKAIDDHGVMVLNADNPLVLELGQQLTVPVCWYSENPEHLLIVQQKHKGQPAVYVSNDQFTYFDGDKEITLCPVSDVPITFHGSAKHNVQNALGVIGLCYALNLPEQAIVQGLKRFGSTPEDNPGRGNLYQKNGAQVIVDFAHNEHSMRAVVDMARQLPATKRIVMFSHAGDRSDSEMQKLTEAVAELQADLYIAAEVSKYLRGRAPMEVPKISKAALRECGVSEENILISSSPTEGAKRALTEANDGAVILLFTLDEREEVQALLT